MNAQELALWATENEAYTSSKMPEKVEKSGESVLSTSNENYVVRTLNISERILKRVGPGSIGKKS